MLFQQGEPFVDTPQAVLVVPVQLLDGGLDLGLAIVRSAGKGGREAGAGEEIVPLQSSPGPAEPGLHGLVELPDPLHLSLGRLSGGPPEPLGRPGLGFVGLFEGKPNGAIDVLGQQFRQGRHALRLVVGCDAGDLFTSPPGELLRQACLPFVGPQGPGQAHPLDRAFHRVEHVVGQAVGRGLNDAEPTGEDDHCHGGGGPSSQRTSQDGEPRRLPWRDLTHRPPHSFQAGGPGRIGWSHAQAALKNVGRLEQRRQLLSPLREGAETVVDRGPSSDALDALVQDLFDGWFALAAHVTRILIKGSRALVAPCGGAALGWHCAVRPSRPPLSS